MIAECQFAWAYEYKECPQTRTIYAIVSLAAVYARFVLKGLVSTARKAQTSLEYLEWMNKLKDCTTGSSAFLILALPCG